MEHIARNDCKYKFYIKTYHISENDYNKAKTLSNKGEYAFRIFLMREIFAMNIILEVCKKYWNL